MIINYWTTRLLSSFFKLLETSEPNERNTKETELTAEKAKVTAKETELREKIAEIAGLAEAKTTQELITKLNALEASKYDPTKIAELKTLLTELKNKEPKEVDISQLKAEIKKDLPKNWSIWGILALGAISLIGIAYLVWKKEKKEIEL